MLDALNTIVMAIADPLFGWMLALPTDVILIIVGFGTGAVMTLARLFTTNQDLLRRCDEDKKVLGKMLKEAKKAGDKDRVKAIQASQGGIAMKAFRAEGMPLLLALIPIVLLTTWCWQRVGFHPPQDGEAVKVEAFFPVSAAGQIVHLVPQDGLEAEGGWVATIEPEKDPNPKPEKEGKAAEAQGDVPAEKLAPQTGESEAANATEEPEPPFVPTYASAVWHVKGKAQAEPYVLQMRYKEGTYEMPFRVGQRTYEPELLWLNPEGPVTVIQQWLREVRLFGIVPGYPQEWWPHVPIGGWLIAYMLIAVPSVFLTKWLFRIH